MRFHRRKYIVDLPFQAQLITRFSAIVFVVSLVIGTVTLLVAQNQTPGLLSSEIIFSMLALTILLVSTAASMVVMLMTLFVSHRIVGPLVRLKKEIALLKSGSLKRNFTTRRKDQLKDLSASLQEMSDVLYGRHDQLKNSHVAIVEFFKNEEVSMKTSSREKLTQILQDLETNVNYFK